MFRPESTPSKRFIARLANKQWRSKCLQRARRKRTLRWKRNNLIFEELIRCGLPAAVLFFGEGAKITEQSCVASFLRHNGDCDSLFDLYWRPGDQPRSG